MTGRLWRMLWPSSVAVVGASPDLSGFGGQTLDLLLAHGFPGRVVPVNPKYEEIAGLPAVPSVAGLCEPVDLALVVVPAPAVLEVVKQCARARVGGVAIFSSGFAESGPAGAALQDEVLAVARAAGMRVLGPNCQGFFNLHGSVAATFSPAADPRRGLERAIPGNVAVVSQSGALGFAVFNSGTALGLGFSHVVSCGNGADVDVLDLLELLVEDEATDVVLVVLEGLDDGDRFRALAARAAATGTRLVVSKLGRSAAGSRAAASHTAHLAGSSAAYDAVFERHGVIQATDLEELVDLGMALARSDAAAGERVGIVSTSGGAGVWLADACDEIGLEVPEDPLDLTGKVVREANVARAVRALVENPAHDVVILGTSLSDPLILAREAPAFAELARTSSKPILVLTYTRPSAASIDLLAELGLPWATSPARLARMAHHLVAAGRRPPQVESTRIAGPSPSSYGRRVLTEPEAKRLLRAWKVAVPEGAVAGTGEEAAHIAEGLGGRVAMKIVSAAVAHKSAVGGVRLDVEPARAAAVFDGLGADAVLVERMVDGGHEVIVGVLQDATFGPLVMVGSGGVHAELLADVRFLPLPVDHAEATRAIGRLRGAPMLDGADVAALADLLVRVAAIAGSGELAELDLNPVVVHEAGRGVTALDAWAVLT